MIKVSKKKLLLGESSSSPVVLDNEEKEAEVQQLKGQERLPRHPRTRARAEMDTVKLILGGVKAKATTEKKSKPADAAAKGKVVETSEKRKAALPPKAAPAKKSRKDTSAGPSVHPKNDPKTFRDYTGEPPKDGKSAEVEEVAVVWAPPIVREDGRPIM